MGILKHIDVPIILIFLGSVMVAIGGIWSSMQKSEKDTLITKKNEQIIESQKLVQAKTQEIADLTKSNEAVMTGGDSFCYVTLSFYEHEQALSAHLHHMGKNPVYDISVRILDIQQWKRWRAGEQVVSAYELHPRNIASGAVHLTDIPIPEIHDNLAYHISITARNGSWKQYLLFSRVNGKWKMATRVLRDHTREEIVLYEHVHDEYPSDENGEIDWNVFKDALPASGQK